MLPETLTFKCPGRLCQPKKEEEEKPVDKCATRQMPDTSKCPTKKTPDQCQPPPEEKKCDSAPPKVADQCDPPEKEENNNCCEEELKCPEYNTEKAPCGTSLSGNTGANPNCNCSRPVAPRPRAQIPAGCSSKSANCGPNTACTVQPLTMVYKDKCIFKFQKHLISLKYIYWFVDYCLLVYCSRRRKTNKSIATY